MPVQAFSCGSWRYRLGWFAVHHRVSLLSRERPVVKERIDLERQRFELVQALLEGFGEFFFVVEDDATFFFFFAMSKYVANFSLLMKVVGDFFVVFGVEFQSF